MIRNDPADLKEMFAQKFKAAAREIYGIVDIYETTDDEEAPNILRFIVELSNDRSVEFIIQDA